MCRRAAGAGGWPSGTALTSAVHAAESASKNPGERFERFRSHAESARQFWIALQDRYSCHGAAAGRDRVATAAIAYCGAAALVQVNARGGSAGRAHSGCTGDRRPRTGVANRLAGTHDSDVGRRVAAATIRTGVGNHFTHYLLCPEQYSDHPQLVGLVRSDGIVCRAGVCRRAHWVVAAGTVPPGAGLVRRSCVTVVRKIPSGGTLTGSVSHAEATLASDCRGPL